MMPDLKPYSFFLKEGKWMSKTDFIYKVKSHYDCSDEKLQRFIQYLYKTSFHKIGKGNKGEILIQ